MISHIGKLFPHLDDKFPEGRNPCLLKDKPSRVTVFTTVPLTVQYTQKVLSRYLCNCPKQMKEFLACRN